MEELTLKLSLLELYGLLGDDMGINFLYDELPGVVVTIGFTKDGSEEEENEEDDSPTKH